MGGGAWPFLVGGAICLVNSVNERDLSLLNSYELLSKPGAGGGFGPLGLGGILDDRVDFLEGLSRPADGS